MKVLFVRMPYRCFWERNTGYPLSIGLLAAYLKKKTEKVEIDFLDFELMDVLKQSALGRGPVHFFKKYFFSEYSHTLASQKYWESVHTEVSSIWEEMCQKIIKQSPDMVAVQCYTVNMTSVKIFCNLLKKKCSTIKIVLGGPHINLRARETMSAIKSVDYCVENNVLDGLHQLVLVEKNKEYQKLQEIAGIWFRQKGECKPGKGTALPLDMDLLPFADRFLEDPANYASAQYIATSLGCAWKCSYCSAHKLGRGKVVYRSLENVIEELRQLKAQGFYDIRITDDTFTASKKRVKKFVELVDEAGLSDMCFSFGARVDTIDRELLDILSGLNISSITLGVESGSDRILNEVMKKKIQVQDVLETLPLLHQYGVRFLAFFMIGNPGESYQEMESSYHLAAKMKLSGMEVSIATPLPETDYEVRAREKDLLFTIDNFYKLTSQDPFVHNLSEVSLPELDRFYKKFKRLQLRIVNRERLTKWSTLLVDNPLLTMKLLLKKYYA
jgi:radical SAM superfamily enzyme YgiQ (UPF0313 family)